MADRTPHASHLPQAMPANDPPRWQTFAKVADECGFRNERAVRDWCRRRGIPYRRDGGFSWVDRNAVDAAIAAGPRHVVPTPTTSASVAAWVSSTLGR